MVYPYSGYYEAEPHELSRENVYDKLLNGISSAEQPFGSSLPLGKLLNFFVSPFSSL